ncbi:MAG: ABC transporter substrate-binding protein [Xanthobacteraceae bacterium]
MDVRTFTDRSVNPYWQVLKFALRDLGYVEGQNLQIDVRATPDGDFQKLPMLAQEVVALRPDVILAASTPVAVAAHRATSTIPIVMITVSDPVGTGLIKSLARPGGNVTGLSSNNDEITTKSVELLYTLVPSAKRIAILTSDNPAHPIMMSHVRTAARSLNLDVVEVNARTPADLEDAFARMRREKCEALIVLADPRVTRVADLATQYRLPAVFQVSVFAEQGGLASYSADFNDLFRRAAGYVDKIFKGANPAELPVELPTKFELLINLKAAKTLGITIPESFLLRADKVIE